MSWHCEDAAINYSQLPSVTSAWHEIVADLRRRTDVFDDWGMFAYTQGSTGVDYLTEIDVGIWEQQLDDRAWELWVDAKRAIARVSLDHGGSISACHGSCREGEVDLVPEELGRGFDVMLDIKRTLDPNNIMNPGKYHLDRAYAARRAEMAYRYDEQMQPPEPRRVSEVAITTHEHVFEVDPRLMERWVLQQTFPNWDSLRIMNARGDHLDWMHAHFAYERRRRARRSSPRSTRKPRRHPMQARMPQTNDPSPD